MSCPHCADASDRELARRLRVLHLLAIVEHPTALPADAALRIGGELLAWAAQEEPGYRCEHPVAFRPWMGPAA